MNITIVTMSILHHLFGNEKILTGIRPLATERIKIIHLSRENAENSTLPSSKCGLAIWQSDILRERTHQVERILRAKFLAETAK